MYRILETTIRPTKGCAVRTFLKMDDTIAKFVEEGFLLDEF